MSGTARLYCCAGPGTAQTVRSGTVRNVRAGTDRIRPHRVRRYWAVLSHCEEVRFPYAMPGADIAYGGTCYAMSGTDIAYGARSVFPAPSHRGTRHGTLLFRGTDWGGVVLTRGCGLRVSGYRSGGRSSMPSKRHLRKCPEGRRGRPCPVLRGRMVLPGGWRNHREYGSQKGTEVGRGEGGVLREHGFRDRS
eukprot:202683-Rhodomonas_salina.1